MKKVKAILLLKKSDTWTLEIFDKKRVISECVEQWHKTPEATSIELSMEIKSKFQFKTQSQLGYIHASVKPTLLSAIKERGDERHPDTVWANLKAEVGFIEEKTSVVTGTKYWDVRSLATASKEDVKEFIDKLVRWAGEWAIEIETPEDYKKRLGIKELK